MTSEAAAKKDIQKLQRAIVDGLEDVKAQDIQVFNTEHLSPLFERVIIASGTSNRQTKALAASVRDAVREAGFNKPRVEGEENGEWIIADCGAAVVHIMQPAIRQYYHLEDLWGDKPVRIKFGADKPTPAAKAAAQAVQATKAQSGQSEAAKSGSLRRSSAAKQGVAEAFPSKAALAKEGLSKSGARSGARSGAKSGNKSAPKPTTAKSATKTTSQAAGKTAVKKAAPVKVVTAGLNKPAAKKAVAKKAPAKKAPVKRPAARRAP